ncbi:regulatory protein RecX [Roseateles sp.]|jgi:regulatory protein|uniref:regulatory protein RecX n=1 Tax=Roseateles sp. TaxID=1971397 RepID=UPI003919D084
MKPLSLKMRAIALLAQREHSLMELRGKLLRLARARAAERAAQAEAAAAFAEEGGAQTPAMLEPESGAASPDLEIEVDTLLVWLQAQGYLDESRFVESRVHARAARYGNRRIQQELSQHGLSLDAEAHARLKDSELERAREVWRRKFGGAAPEDASARAKQTRFLVGRGFSSEVVRRVLRGDHD